MNDETQNHNQEGGTIYPIVIHPVQSITQTQNDGSQNDHDKPQVFQKSIHCISIFIFFIFNTTN